MPMREFGVPKGYGRGGAGNIDLVTRENERIAADLEASQSAADSFTQTPSVDLLPRQEPSYVGRGGAGNYGSIEDPNNWDDVNHTPNESFSQNSDNSQAQSPISPTYGRGGAGNYAARTSENQRTLSRRMTEEDKKREKLKADVEQGVKEQLAMPQKAKLPGGNPY